MPVKRRKPKNRLDDPALSPAQAAFLGGVPWRGYHDPKFSDDPHLQFREASRLCWLTQYRPGSEAMPDGSLAPSRLVERYGVEALAEWTRKRPFTRPEWWWRLCAPVEAPDDVDELDYLRRHRLLSVLEIALLRERS